MTALPHSRALRGAVHGTAGGGPRADYLGEVVRSRSPAGGGRDGLWPRRPSKAFGYPF
jgi:hypothetical protein